MTPADPRQIDPRATLLRLMAIAAVAGAALGLVTLAPVRAVWGDAIAAAMLAGLGVAVLGSWFGSIPLVLTMNIGPAAFASGVLAGLGLRFAATIALAAAVHLAGIVANEPFLLWVGMMQLLILAVDVTAQIRLSRQVLGGAA